MPEQRDDGATEDRPAERAERPEEADMAGPASEAGVAEPAGEAEPTSEAEPTGRAERPEEAGGKPARKAGRAHEPHPAWRTPSEPGEPGAVGHAGRAGHTGPAGQLAAGGSTGLTGSTGSAEPPTPAGASGHAGQAGHGSPWGAPGRANSSGHAGLPGRPGHAGIRPAQHGWAAVIRPADPAPVRPATLWGVHGTGLAAALLLGDGLGIGLLITVLPAAFAAYAAARTAGRKARAWTVAWALGCLALLAVPALRDAGWPAVLAVFAAVGLGALALHGSRTWPGVLLAPLGFFDAAPTGLAWAWQGVRGLGGGSRDRWWPLVRAAAVAVVLLVLFGALFASADAAFADLLGELAPDVSVGDGPFRVLLFLFGVVAAVAAARAAAGPLRWDRIRVAPAKPRSRAEWAIPLIVLDLLFAGFNTVQLTVLFGGYDRVLERTGLTYAEYARQGFWQLLWATLLTLVVIALALRWAPRSGPRDRSLVRAVLGTLCVLTLVVVASALRRMDLYVDAYGLTRLRLSVAAVELWLGLVIVLIVAAGVFGARWLPRAVVASAGAAVLAFGLASPDGLIAERNVARFEKAVDKDGAIDLAYFQSLSADAVPALDRLPEPYRSCALRGINDDLADRGRAPWYATSLGEQRALRILEKRPVSASYEECSRLGAFADRYEY
ncbi:DUF4153 domain-containing protein [Streptomyces sp. NPDC048603]|uniref:DUF4153 domain-containing protein n=1 Tax=Streptomyces sp. NPDC048603 TaxID=3365577 RepID=UPI0037196858